VPDAIVIAGANGAGKTTFPRQALPVLHPGVPFLNVDEIQSEDSAFAHPVAAGRELLRRLDEAEGRLSSFAAETTLSSTSGIIGTVTTEACGSANTPKMKKRSCRLCSRRPAGRTGMPCTDRDI
jgi:predicted ABC-type ATPase